MTDQAATVRARREKRRREKRSSAWHDQALAEIKARRFVIGRLELKGHADQITAILDRAEVTANASKGSVRAWWNGAAIDGTWGLMNAADEAIFQVADDSYVLGQMPRLHRRVRSLPEGDERRKRAEATSDKDTKLSQEKREELATAFHAANCEARKVQARVRSFRNTILLWALLVLFIAIGVGAFGAIKPALVPLCFTPEAQVVCPTVVEAVLPGAHVTGQPPAAMTAQDQQDLDQRLRWDVNPWDVALIELTGLIAASVAAAAALRKTRGTSTPYNVPIALALLKLPLGALTAVLGLLFMRGGFVPGLSALDTPAQILAWAILFGYAQEVFTRMVDNRGHDVLDAANAPAKST